MSQQLNTLPQNFEPYRTNRWVLTLDGLDAYLVRDVILPKIRSGDSGIEYEDMIVTCYNTHGCDINGNVLTWMKQGALPREATFKFFDQVGNVTEQWRIGVSPRCLNFNHTTYEKAEMFLTTIVLECTNVFIEFPA